MRDAQQSVHLIAATVGYISLVALWISTIWGIVLRNGWGFTRVRHVTIYGIHQTVTLLGLTLGGVHALAQLAKPLGPVRVIDQLVPFINPSDPIGIGLGVVALELMIALTLSILVQQRLGYHRWRRLHTLGYLAYALVTGHVLISGSGASSIAVRLAVTASLVIVIGLSYATTLARRLSRRRGLPRGAGRDVVLNVDASRCVRYGFCAHEAPELFRLQSDGRLSYRAAVSAESVEPALRAAQACPARAIMLGRHPTAVVMATEATGDRPEPGPPVRPVTSEQRLRGR